MFAVRIHGRGGQGVVTMAELLAISAFAEGHEAQAIPSFGSERMGAPVMAFCRVDDKPIVSRDPVSEPDAVIICDPTLLHHVEVFAGLSPSGLVLMNSARTPAELGLATELGAGVRCVCLPAAEIARHELGKPLPTGPLLGALAAMVTILSPASLHAALVGRFPAALADANARAARVAYDLVAGMPAAKPAGLPAPGVSSHEVVGHA